MSKNNFESMISTLDINLFNEISSETSPADKFSLLAIQNALRQRKRSYVYLEIGSHLGGTIQPHLMDPQCQKIYSIDKRPLGSSANRVGELMVENRLYGLAIKG